MEAGGELKWDIEPCNGRSCFFTRESYEKYCLGPTLPELLLFSSKASTEPSQKDPEASASQASVPKSQPIAPSSTKDILPFPEPRVPYPRFSSLTAFEQDAYVKLMIKFLNKRDTNVSFGQVKEYNHYQFLKSKSICEVPEFQKFLQNAARSCAEDYNLLCADADLYVTKLIESCQMYVKNYPPLYTVHEITSILGGKFVPDLTFNLEKCLLQMGSVKLVKVKFPSDEIPLPTMYKKVIQMLSPKKKADRIQENVTLDPNISKLVPKYCPQVVLTSQALFTLLNNHAPGFSEQWEIPLCVRTMDGKDGQPCKVVYMDSPLPKKELSTREKNLMFHDVVLGKFMVKNAMIPLKSMLLDKDHASSSVDKQNADSSLPPHEEEEMDFSIDVTELETFGSLDKDASTNTIVSDSESPELKPSSLKNSLLNRLKMEKEIINSNPTKTRCSSDVVNDVKKKRLSSQEPSKTSDSDTQLRTTSNESDSDDDKLVIDVDSKMREHSNKAATPSIPTPPQPPRDRKSAKKISKDIDPLGQILKMQTQLLKTDPKKMEQASLVTLERSEPSTQHAPSFQQNLSSSFMESQRKVDVSHPSNVKYLLSHELMTLKEDSAEYEVEPEENCSYKLFSLDDLLLLVKSPVHMARTRSIKKTCKVQIPSFLLSKVNYQTCYGVEVLTDSERCRLWTESLIHSKCEMFVGHVDALTSKFFMLEEITVENVKESMSNFNPANCLNTLRHVLKWVSGASHQDGSYLLSHVSGDSSVYLYKSTKDQQRGAYNLHEAHCNPPKAPSSLSVPWVPLNPNLLLKYHIQHGRPPCTFPPVPEMDAGINKQNQPKKSTNQQKTQVSPVTKAKKGRNRIHRLKEKQKIWKAAAEAAAAQAAAAASGSASPAALQGNT